MLLCPHQTLLWHHCSFSTNPHDVGLLVTTRRLRAHSRSPSPLPHRRAPQSVRPLLETITPPIAVLAVARRRSKRRTSADSDGFSSVAVRLSRPGQKEEALWPVPFPSVAPSTPLASHWANRLSETILRVGLASEGLVKMAKRARVLQSSRPLRSGPGGRCRVIVVNPGSASISRMSGDYGVRQVVDAIRRQHI
jgi:hypothetical protein